MENPNLITYQEKFREDFKALNLAWIREHFKVEQKDLDQVNNPQRCLEEGGEIFFVTMGDRAAGTCAMYPSGPVSYELAKMAVHPDFRGQGFGDLLMNGAEAWVRSKGAKEILILSNTVLAPAIKLYEKHGFTTTHLGPHPDYERCNIEMRKSL
jgi:putative acetyltransferase